MPASGKRNPGLPSFWEFVQYLKEVKKEEMDQHWMPVAGYCDPCKFQYKIIVKFEHLDREGVCLNRILNPGKILNHGKKYHVMGGGNQGEHIHRGEIVYVNLKESWVSPN